MKSSKRIYISLILAGAVVPFVMASVAFAATVPSSSYAGIKTHMAGNAKFTGQKPVAFGKVTTVNGSTITVSDTKTSFVYTVDVSNAKITEGFGKGAQSLGYTSIKVGDEVVIMGTISGSSVTATSVFDGVESHAHAAAPHVIGTVSEINGSSISISVQNSAYTVNTTSSTTITKDGKADTFSDIAVGQTVMAVGTIDAATSTVTATKVNIVTKTPRAHVTGAVTGITGTTLTVQPKKGSAYTVDASSASVTTGFGKNATTVPFSKLLALGQSVMVVGSHVSGSTSIVATSIRLVQAKKGLRTSAAVQGGHLTFESRARYRFAALSEFLLLLRSMAIPMHHKSVRRRIYQNLEEFPSKDPFKKFLDRLIFVVGFL